jgi:ABC-type glycerol-3-phosphate transport system substrate-binding protein
LGPSWQRAYTRRQALGTGAAGLGAFYLAACGGGSASSDSRDVAVVFDFEYAGRPGSMKRYWEALRDRLEDSGVDARLTDLAAVNYANMQARLQSNHSAKSGPTLETWFSDWFTWEFIAQDALAPIDNYVSADAPDDWLFTSQIDNRYWGAPFYAEQALLVANRDHLRKAGVEVGRRFESWDAFIRACAKIKRTGETPITLGASDGFGSDKWSQAISMEFMISIKEWGLNLLGELPTSEPVVSGWIDRFYQFHQDSYVNGDAAKITEQQAIGRFLEGEGAFAMMNPGVIFSEDPERFQVVGYWNGSGNYAAPVAVAGDLVLMTSYGENKEAAGRVVEFMHEPEQLKLFNRITGELPCNRKFDPSDLGELARTAWDLINDPGDGKIATYPRNYVPTIGVTLPFELGVRPLSGEDPSKVRAEYDKRVAQYRERNSAEVDEFRKYLDSIEG